MSYSLVFLVSNIVEKLWIFDYRVNAHSSNVASTSLVAACFKSVMKLDVIVIENNPDQEDHGSNEEDSFFCEHVVEKLLCKVWQPSFKAASFIVIVKSLSFHLSFLSTLQPACKHLFFCEKLFRHSRFIFMYGSSFFLHSFSIPSL